MFYFVQFKTENADENDPTKSQTPIKSEPAVDDSQMKANVNGSYTSIEATKIEPTVSDATPEANKIGKSMSDSEPFLQLVAQRLDQTTNALKRRKLENAILQAIVQAEKEQFQKICHSTSIVNSF